MGDRICIMSHGKILTLDTSFNIKKKFGVGYNLLIESRVSEEAIINGVRSKSNNIEIKDKIDHVVLRSGLLEGAEESPDSSKKRLIYTIPFEQQHNIPRLLEQLEARFENQIYIDIEMNSLEDAYVNIAKAEERLHALATAERQMDTVRELTTNGRQETSAVEESNMKRR